MHIRLRDLMTKFNIFEEVIENKTRYDRNIFRSLNLFLVKGT